MIVRYFIVSLLLSFSFWTSAQSGAEKPKMTEPTDPKATEDWTSRPQIVAGVQTKWDIPSDAVILLGNTTDQWVKKDGTPIEWTFDKGVLTVKPGSGDIVSKASFGDSHLHLEWRSPLVIKGDGQGRGNSGVFLQSRYEIQVLDNYNNETYYNGQAGSVYKQHSPLVNATSKSGEWNVYDIIYKAPRFDKFGTKLESARVTVIHNGYVVQNNTEIFGTTEYIGFPKNTMHGGAPFILQDHGDLVSYRNIWVRRI
jgi:hypothetical protein